MHARVMLICLDVVIRGVLSSNICTRSPENHQSTCKMYAVCTLGPLIAIDMFQPRLGWLPRYAYRLIQTYIYGGGGGGGGFTAESLR